MSFQKDKNSAKNKKKNVNSKTSNNENNVVPMETVSVNRKLWNHRMQIFGLALLVVVAVSIVGVVIYIKYKNYVYTSYEVINTVDRVQVSTSNVLSYNNYFLTYSTDGMHCTDSKGNDIWSTSFEMQNPMVVVCGEYVAAADYNGRTIYIFNSSGEAGTIQTGCPIRNIKISANGVVAIVLDDGDVTPIEMYLYNGEKIASMHTTMAKSGYPVTLGISDDSKLVGVSYLYLDKGILTTKIAFYNFGEVGKNSTDNLVSGYDYQGEIVPVLDFLNESTAFAIANDRLMFYEGKERPTNTANVLIHDTIKSVYYGSDYVGLVYNNSTGETKYCMDIYNTSGKLENRLTFDMEYSDIFFDHNRVVLYNASSAAIYTVQGDEKFIGDFSEPVILMLPTNNISRYILVTNDKIQTIVLQ